jgi:glycine dehydrogenase
MAMCRRVNRKNRSNTFFVAADCHPQTIDVIRGRAEPLGLDVVVGDPANDSGARDCFGALLQYPGTYGDIRDYRKLIADMRERETMVVMAADLLALTLLTPPGEMGADVAVGSAQRFGVPLFFGGPHAAYMATRDAHKRAMPGRLVGVSVDSHGKPAYRLALQTREQHIRREKATSNICTAQALLAVTAAMYAVYHGPDGLRTIAQRVHRLTAILATGLRQLGWTVPTTAYFDTITVNTGERTGHIHQAARDRGFNLREVGRTTVGISLDETASREDVEVLLSVFAEGSEPPRVEDLDRSVDEALPKELRRTSDYLTHPVFNSYRSETEMLRYLRLLADRDLALDRAMIPLGSCTMKLNATTEMLPISWEGFSNIHPFVPPEQAEGYRQLITDLERMLCEVTGYHAVSLQPNAGAQGEYAGLLAIRAYHESRGEGHRDVCLIPSSAHGTNPASAQMAGMKVEVVRCDDNGNVDVEDLRARAETHSDDLAALMITYPSTHGVFEAQVREVCDIVHRHGGQVYIDGANLNAMVGLCKPGEFGGDVSHLNLHKTFCIPHGGGGPGVGPIGVAEHLAPFLPGHPTHPEAGSRHAVSAAPWGSAGILPISWAYIRLMGRRGLTEATRVAILNANYMAKRLGEHYPVLYTGADGLVAHECIIDLRPIKESCEVTVDDVAKRLIDFGFHAPTMSFPVAGTLMIEPTESESRAELDRFCDAMIAIREEIRAVENGEMDAAASPLRNAPHTTEHLTAEWTHPYSREQAVFPARGLRNAKYWSPVGRVDNVYGDRNLVCSCPPMSAYEGDAETVIREEARHG